jgi:hypothetical protein
LSTADWTDPADDNNTYIRSKVVAERAAWASAVAAPPAVKKSRFVWGTAFSSATPSAQALVGRMTVPPS